MAQIAGTLRHGGKRGRGRGGRGSEERKGRSGSRHSGAFPGLVQGLRGGAGLGPADEGDLYEEEEGLMDQGDSRFGSSSGIDYGDSD